MNHPEALRRCRASIVVFIAGLVLIGLTVLPLLGEIRLACGTDWLAFAHLAIAVFFIGPLLDPVRNRWVITAGLICCAAVIPMALIAGSIRAIPISWRLIDCSFGILGAVPLLYCRRLLRALESE